MATVLIPLSPDARGTRRVGAHLGAAGLRCGPLRGGDLARTAWKGAGQVWPGQCPRPLPVGKASLNRRQTASRDLLATLGVVRTEFFESLIYQTSSGESWLPPVAGVQCRTDSVAGTGVKHPGLAIFSEAPWRFRGWKAAFLCEALLAESVPLGWIASGGSHGRRNGHSSGGFTPPSERCGRHPLRRAPAASDPRDEREMLRQAGEMFAACGSLP